MGYRYLNCKRTPAFNSIAHKINLRIIHFASFQKLKIISIFFENTLINKIPYHLHSCCTQYFLYHRNSKMKKMKDQKADVLLSEKAEHGSKPNRYSESEN